MKSPKVRIRDQVPKPSRKTPPTLVQTNKQRRTRGILKSHAEQDVRDLAEQAQWQLQHELLGPWLDPKEDTLVVFFSFSNGLNRATVVHFIGKNIDDIWAKFFAWKKRCLDKHHKARWLRLDFVIRRNLITWQQCLEQIANHKRNYFRYGICMDIDFHYPFLEQELNANAMLYLGHKHQNAGFNPSNATRYGMTRFGSSFSMPTSDEQQVMTFSTQGVLVQPYQRSILLHGYCGGNEGRNTGLRIINKLTERHVKDLIEQSSQYLADQVSATGRFTYGIHPCFDKEIHTYNTLRHASTTYSMLEAWEVTGSPNLKSAIDRSIQCLTSQLIHQHKTKSNTIVSYLHDIDNEIKLGGNAVSLLALVKYTQLTQDQSYLQLMEQLALGILDMQDPGSGRFHHVLNTSDLSIKDEFRIVYYDGEAAFGLMRLFGLTKDPRWLTGVERAFSFFIDNDYWKVHDHWLGYCVNELTIYRPNVKYYEFGIKNFLGHLDFVSERITTFPTLLELMMASHQMILRLQSSDEHRYLLEDVDLSKFYSALEKRSHYLLNGFFSPELAMYFKNPQSILGSFFIRHHSFRVRIDDVEHYLSGFVAYLQKLLLGTSLNRSSKQQDPELGQSHQYATPQILFLNQDFGDHLTGIEHAAIQRALLFKTDLHIDPIIISLQYRPFLQDNVCRHLQAKGCDSAVRVLGLYDFIQNFDLLCDTAKDTADYLPQALDPNFPDYIAEIVPGYKDVRYRDATGRLFAYKVYSKVHGSLTHINYFSNGIKIAADIFHYSGLKCSHRVYEPGATKLAFEIYYNPIGKPVFFRIFEHTCDQLPLINRLQTGFYSVSLQSNSSPGVTSEQATLTDDVIDYPIGLNALTPFIDQSSYLGGESDFAAWALYKLVTSIDNRRFLFVCDKNKSFFLPAVYVRDKLALDQQANQSVRIISMIHSTHYKGSTSDSDIKSHYRDLLMSDHHADQIVVLTPAQKNDIAGRFPHEKIEAIPHALIVSPNAADERNLTCDDQLQKIVYVARLSPEKDHITALDIFAKLLTNVQTARLHLYGEGSQRALIEAHIEKLGIASKVVLEGYHSDIPSIYRSASCAILTSKMEGFSLSLLEAMAYGCPSVAFDINYGPRDLISDGETGFLVPYGDTNLFAERLQTLITQTQLADAFSQQCKRRFEEKFSHQLISHQWNDIISSIFLDHETIQPS